MKGIKRFSIVLTVVLYALIAVNLPIFAADVDVVQKDPETGEVEVIETIELPDSTGGDEVAKEVYVTDPETEQIVKDIPGTAEIEKDPTADGNWFTGDEIQSVDDDIDVNIDGEGVDFVVVEQGNSTDNQGEAEGFILTETDGEINPGEVVVGVAPELGKEVVSVDAVINELVNHGIFGDRTVGEDVPLEIVPIAEDGEIIEDPENGKWLIKTPSITYELVEIAGFYRLYDTSNGDYEEIDITIVTQDLAIDDGVLNKETGALELINDGYQIIVDEGDEARVTIFNGDIEIDKYIEGYEETYTDLHEGLAIENIRGVVKDADGNIVQDGIIVEYDKETGNVTLITTGGKEIDGKYTVYLDGYYKEDKYGEPTTSTLTDSRRNRRQHREYQEAAEQFGRRDTVVVSYDEEDTRTTLSRENRWDRSIDKEVAALKHNEAWARVAEIDIIIKHTEIDDEDWDFNWTEGFHQDDNTNSYIVITEHESAEKEKSYDLAFKQSNKATPETEREVTEQDWWRDAIEVTINVDDVDVEGYSAGNFKVYDPEGNEIEVTGFEHKADGTWDISFKTKDFANTEYRRVWIFNIPVDEAPGTYRITWDLTKNPTPTPKKASGYTFVATGI